MLFQPVLDPATATTAASEAPFIASSTGTAFQDSRTTPDQLLTLVNESFQTELSNQAPPSFAENPQPATASPSEQQRESDSANKKADLAAAAAVAQPANGQLTPLNPASSGAGSTPATVTLNQAGGLSGAADRAVPLTAAQAVQSAASSEQQNNPQAASQLTPEAGGSSDLAMPSVRAMQNSLKSAQRARAITNAP